MGGQLQAAFNEEGKVAAGQGAPGGGAAAMGALGPGGSAPPNPDAALLASAQPYAHAFEKLGLKVGAGPDGRPAVVDRSGRPAGADAKRRLAAAIDAEPSALRRDPNYLNPAKGGIAREDFNALKEAYRKERRKRRSDFKHIELTPEDEERDFSRSESCDLVSGDCNPHAKKSYAKGEDVPSGDLSRIVSALRGKMNAADERRGRLASTGLAAALRRRVGGALSRIAGWDGGESSVGVDDSGASLPRRKRRKGAAQAPEEKELEGDEEAAAERRGRPLLAGLSQMSPLGFVFFALGLIGAALVAGALLVFFRKDRRSFNR
jgi:hypothetical protein